MYNSGCNSAVYRISVKEEKILETAQNAHILATVFILRLAAVETNVERRAGARNLKSWYFLLQLF